MSQYYNYGRKKAEPKKKSMLDKLADMLPSGLGGDVVSAKRKHKANLEKTKKPKK